MRFKWSYIIIELGVIVICTFFGTPRSPGPLIMEETSANVGGGGGDDERRRDAFLSWTPFFYSIGEATEEEHAV